MYSNIVQILISPTLTAKWDIWLSIISSILSPRDLEMNHMPGSSNSLFNNSTRPHTIYCYRWMPYKWFIVCFPCSTQSFFCAKLSHICSVISNIECFHKISQTKPNIVGLKIKLCTCFYFHVFVYLSPVFTESGIY